MIYHSEGQDYKNPFYHNYVFHDYDINRFKISKWEYPILFFLRTYVQISENYLIKYKKWRGQYFIVGFEKWPSTTKEGIDG